MDLRTISVQLLKHEEDMLHLYDTPPRTIPDLKRWLRRMIALVFGMVAVCFLRNWILSYQQDHENILSIFLRVPAGLSVLALIGLGLGMLFVLFNLFSDLRQRGRSRQYNKDLEARRAHARKCYDDLRRQATQLKQTDPALEDRHLFFDDPHSLDAAPAPVPHLDMNTILQIGELATSPSDN